MKKITRRVFMGTGAAAAVITVGLIHQTRKASAPNAADRTLNLYSARHYDTDSAVYQSFTEATGVQVNLIEAEADPLIERIKSEGSNSPADVLITVDAGRLWQAEQEGLFQPVTSEILQQSVPEHLRHPQGLWFGLSRRARVILYNKSKINPDDLSTYEELADPKWRGQILVRSSSNIYNQSLVGSLLEANGLEATEAWASGIVANFARPPEGNDTAQIKACAAGVGGLALANTYYYIRLAKSDDPAERAIAKQVGVFFPNQRDRGTHINISGAGVLKTSPNQAAAIQFIEHLVSPQAQEIFAKGNNEYPVVANVPLDPVVARLGGFKADSMSAIAFGRNHSTALQLMDRAGWT